MSTRAAFVVWLGVGLCGTSSALNACYRACSQVGCVDSEALSFTEEIAKISETDISACREQSCWHGHLAEGALIADGRVDLTSDEPNSDWVNLQVDTLGVPLGKARVTITWVSPRHRSVKIGEVLSATFSDSAGDPILTRSGSVATFDEYYPNGKECDVTACEVAKVDASD